MFKAKNQSDPMTLDVSKEELLAFWQSVMDPTGVGMPNAIGAEIAAYTGESLSTVLSKMARGEQDLKELWERLSPDVSNETSVASFYRDHFTEAYELANWHCGGEGAPPLAYAYAANFARRLQLKRVLDFGSGIGSGSLCFATVGCEVHAADIATRLLAFVQYRVRARGFVLSAIDLNEERPPHEFYDLISCFDVLEHLPDQSGKLRELSSYLKP